MVMDSPGSRLGGWDSLLLQASRSGVLLLLSPPPAAMSCWSELLHQSFVWEKSSRKGPLTRRTRPFNRQAPPPWPRHQRAQILHTILYGNTWGPIFIYRFCRVWTESAKHKYKTAERHLPPLQQVSLSPFISMGNLLHSLQTRGEKRR